MAHEIDNTNAVYTGNKAWHRIGLELDLCDTFADELAAARDAMPVLFSQYDEYEAHIVTNDPAFVGGSTHQIAKQKTRIAKIPDVKAIVRRSDGRIMRRTVGEDTFTLRQPADLWARAEAFAADCPDAHLSFAAYLHHGSRLFVCIDMGDVEINDETHRRYLTLCTGFDGSRKEEIILSVQRAVCANTVAFAAARAQAGDDDSCDGYYATRHTKNCAERIEAADLKIMEILARFDVIKRQLEVLPKIEVTKDEARELIRETMTVNNRFKPKRLDAGRPKAIVEEILSAYDSRSADHAHFYGTANGVYQAVTGYWSHKSTVLGARSNKGVSDEAGTAEKITEYAFRTGARAVRDAHQVMMALAERRGFTGISLDDAGIHVGETLEGDGELGATVI